MNQNPFPTCADAPNNYIGTASYTAKCPNGTEFQGGFEWLKTGNGIGKTISGLVLLRKTVSEWVFLAAHDASSVPRVSKITVSASGAVSSSAVSWASPPTDIESLFVYEGIMFAATGGGTLLKIALSVDETSISVVDSVGFGGVIDNEDCEGAFIHLIDGREILIVASRGSDASPSKIAWMELTTSPLYLVSLIGVTTFTAPFPAASNVRHVSDLRTDHAGNLFVSSASDPGDNGPFSSAVYHVGSLFMAGSDPSLGMIATPREIYRSTAHKIEAICLTPNDSLGMILGADDENFGGFIFAQGQRALGVPVGEPVTVTRQAWSHVSVQDAEAKARELARREAIAVLACRYVARDCVTPQCGYYFYAPVCAYGTGTTLALAADEARAAALAWAALYCPP